MTYHLVFTLQADQDLNKIKVWYDNINTALTQDLFLELSDEFKIFKKSPLIYQTRYKQIRVAFLKRFEYGIHYLIEENQLIVLRILHNKQYFNEKA